MHTPGPWNISKLATPDYDPQFAIYPTEHLYHLAIVMNDNAEANTHLIAAAPDLLAALQLIANSEEFNGDLFVCDFTTLQGVARAALLKATQE